MLVLFVLYVATRETIDLFSLTHDNPESQKRTRTLLTCVLVRLAVRIARAQGQSLKRRLLKQSSLYALAVRGQSHGRHAIDANLTPLYGVPVVRRMLPLLAYRHKAGNSSQQHRRRPYPAVAFDWLRTRSSCAIRSTSIAQVMRGMQRVWRRAHKESPVVPRHRALCYARSRYNFICSIASLSRSLSKSFCSSVCCATVMAWLTITVLT